MDLTPRVLESDRVRLEPLTMGHLDAWCAVGLDAELWKWYTIAPITTRGAMKAYMEMILGHQAEGNSICFATVDVASGTVVGGTRYLNIEPEYRRVEIGSTWIGRAWQRTHINTHAKLLMLGYAFGTLGCVRVELKTDALNERSRAAILRIGAKEEGVFRKHAQTASGRWRDTAYYSVVDDEWPGVRERLQGMCAAR